MTNSFTTKDNYVSNSNSMQPSQTIPCNIDQQQHKAQPAINDSNAQHVTVYNEAKANYHSTGTDDVRIEFQQVMCLEAAFCHL